MAFWIKLTAGGHVTGTGVNARTYTSSDPNNSVFESEENLAETMPERCRPATESEIANAKKNLKQPAKTLPPKPIVQTEKDIGPKGAAHSDEEETPDEEVTEEEAAPASDGLEDMTVADLKKLADAEEIAIDSRANKTQIIEAIRAHRSSTGEEGSE